MSIYGREADAISSPLVPLLRCNRAEDLAALLRWWRLDLAVFEQLLNHRLHHALTFVHFEKKSRFLHGNERLAALLRLDNLSRTVLPGTIHETHAADLAGIPGR